MVALFVWHFNWCRVHSAHGKKPAMAAHLTKRVWTVEELLSAKISEFYKLNHAATRPSPRNEDLIQGKIPETDRQFLRTLETTSLSDLSKDMRTMSQSVAQLANVQNRFIIPGIIAIFASVIVAILVSLFRR
ncbi:MAG TPA: hypothetical protein VMH30_09080 [Verrucomicrobiae bacterium]|nr:hypothetical protein [Verrucomicrobiae bacterium]